MYMIDHALTIEEKGIQDDGKVLGCMLVVIALQQQHTTTIARIIIQINSFFPSHIFYNMLTEFCANCTESR